MTYTIFFKKKKTQKEGELNFLENDLNQTRHSYIESFENDLINMNKSPSNQAKILGKKPTAKAAF